jgi:3-methyladenine DNA glycosylase/8-oxoguanine DNA glycosylase
LQGLAGPAGLTAANLAQFGLDELRSVGLSPQKAAYAVDLVGKANDGTVELRRIGRLPDEQVVGRLPRSRESAAGRPRFS